MSLSESLSSRRNAKPGVVKAKHGTGVWPFANPRPWNMTVTAEETVLIDPVAVAAAASESLCKVGWPGISLMVQDYQLSLIDQADSFVETEVERWYTANRSAVCDELLSRLDSSSNIDSLSGTAKTALKEAVNGYQHGRYLSVVRVLMPEFECFARNVYAGTKDKPNQKNVIDALKDTINQLPCDGTDVIELFSIYHFIDEKLFAACFSATDAQAFGTVPNRHAELHGLASYGNLKGATIMLCVMGFLLQLMAR